MTTLLPQIGAANPTRSVAISGNPTRDDSRSPRRNAPTLLELSQNGGALRNPEFDRKYRSRSEHVEQEERERRKRKTLTERGRSDDREIKTRRKIINTGNKENQLMPVNEAILTDIFVHEKRVKFDASTDIPKETRHKAAPAQKVQPMRLDPLEVKTRKDGVVDVRMTKAGSHTERVQGARKKAQLWTETWSDPGPASERSIR